MDIFNKVFQTKELKKEEPSVPVLTTDEKIKLLSQRRSTMLEDVKLIDEELVKLEELKALEGDIGNIEARRLQLIDPGVDNADIDLLMHRRAIHNSSSANTVFKNGGVTSFIPPRDNFMESGMHTHQNVESPLDPTDGTVVSYKEHQSSGATDMVNPATKHHPPKKKVLVQPEPGEHKELKVGDLTVSPVPSGKKTTMATAMTNAMKK